MFLEDPFSECYFISKDVPLTRLPTLTTRCFSTSALPKQNQHGPAASAVNKKYFPDRNKEMQRKHAIKVTKHVIK